MPTKAEQTAIDALQEMSPVRRAAQLFAATIANAGNTATFGGIGRIGDLVRGTDWGTTGDQLSAQVRAASPVADTASKVIGVVGGGGIARAALPAAISAGRVALTAAPTIGTRAAALGATSPSYAGTIARVAAPAAAALGLGAFLNNGESAIPAAAAEPKTAAAAGESALAAGRAAPESITPQEALASRLGVILGSNRATMSDLQTAGALVPATIKGQPTQKDQVVGQTAALSQAIFANQVAQANELSKTDPAGAKAVVAKATADYFQRNAGLVGLNPANLAMAQMLNPGEEQ